MPPVMPPLVRFLLVHAAIGFAIALVFVALLLTFDLGGLRTLMLSSDMGLVALFMLTFFSGLTFASVQIGVAVMMMGEDEPDENQRGDGHLQHIWQAVRTWLTMPPNGPERAAIPIRVPAKTPVPSGRKPGSRS